MDVTAHQTHTDINQPLSDTHQDYWFRPAMNPCVLAAWGDINKQLISRRDRRTLLDNSNYRLNHAMVVKLFHPYPYSINYLIVESRLFRRIASFLINALSVLLLKWKPMTNRWTKKWICRLQWRRWSIATGSTALTSYLDLLRVCNSPLRGGRWKCGSGKCGTVKIAGGGWKMQEWKYREGVCLTNMIHRHCYTLVIGLACPSHIAACDCWVELHS